MRIIHHTPTFLPIMNLVIAPSRLHLDSFDFFLEESSLDYDQDQNSNTKSHPFELELRQLP